MSAPGWERLFTVPEIALTLGVTLTGLGIVVGGMWVGRQRKAGKKKAANVAATVPAEPPAKAPVSGQRKAFRRAGAWTRITLTDVRAGGPYFEGRVIDFDAAGLGLMLFKEVAVGTTLSVRPSRAPATAPWVQIEVRSCQQADKTLWRVGCHVADDTLATMLRQYG